MLDSKRRLLLKDDQPVGLGPKVVETLIALVESPGQLVTKDELMERLWPNQFVLEANLVQNVHRLRRVLAQGGLEGAIETMPCRGYRFIASIGKTSGKLDSSRRRNGLRWAAAAAFLTLLFARPASAPVHASAQLGPESQRSYTLGRYHLNLRFSGAQADQSVPYFRRVVQNDPLNPLGYSGLADAYLARFDTACNSVATNCRGTAALVVANAREAVALGSNSPEAHTSYAMALYVFYKDYADSDAEFREAIALDRSYALAHHWYANSLLMRGLLAAARAEYQIAISLEPTSPTTYAWLAEDEYLSRHYAQAIRYARESLALYPSRPLSWALVGLAYEQSGDSKSARAAFGFLPGTLPQAFDAELYARSGRRNEALKELRLAQRESGGFGTLELALAWNALGDRAKADAALRQVLAGTWIQRRLAEMDPRMRDRRASY